MVIIEFSIGGLSMEKVTFDSNEISGYQSTIRYIKGKLAAFNCHKATDTIRQGIVTNLGKKFFTYHGGQKLTFDIYRD